MPNLVHLGFAFETLYWMVVGDALIEEFENTIAAKRFLLREINNPHPSNTKLLDDAVSL